MKTSLSRYFKSLFVQSKINQTSLQSNTFIDWERGTYEEKEQVFIEHANYFLVRSCKYKIIAEINAKI